MQGYFSFCLTAANFASLILVNPISSVVDEIVIFVCQYVLTLSVMHLFLV